MSKRKSQTKISLNKDNNNKPDKKNIKLIKKSFPLPPQPENFKQINEIPENGKLELVDYKGNVKECDIYGSPKKKFLNNVTGTISYEDRLKKGLIKECIYNNKSWYIPKNLNFEGSNMFPRPLSLPFVSLSENPDKLVNEVKKERRVTEIKNKKIFSLKKPLKDKSTIPSFICHKIGKNNPYERNYLIKLIDNFITEQKEEHKFDLEYIYKAKNIKALNHYKKKLNENMTNELYNGKIISPSSQKDIKIKYNSIRNTIYNSGLKKDKSNKIINLDLYKKLYKIKGLGIANKNPIFKFQSMLNTFTIKNNNNLDDIYLSDSLDNSNYKTLSPKRNKIHSMKQTYTLFKRPKTKLIKDRNQKMLKENIEFLSEDEKFKNTLTIRYDNNNNESENETFYLNNDKSTSNSKKNLNLYIPNNFFFNNKININRNKDNFNIDKYKSGSTFYKTNKKRNSNLSENNISNGNDKDNYSYTSEDKKDENIFINKFKIGHNFRTIKDINLKTVYENKLLKGFQSNSLKDELRLFKKQRKKKEDTTLMHYLNELELNKKVNKIAFEKEKRMNLFRDNLLKKKLQGKKIFELNYQNKI